jgi:hypothetical protein
MVEAGRVAAFGHFARPFRTVNIGEADFLGLGAVGARLLNRFRLKEWEHFAVFGPDFLFTFVVLDAHYLASSFCYFVDRSTGQKIEHHREGPSFVARLGAALWDDRCSFRLPGYRIDVHNHLEQGRHTARVDLAGRPGAPALSADLEFRADLLRHQPLDVVLRLAPNRPAYSHKMACPAAGTIRIGERRIDLDPARDLVLIDVHKAYYPYRMTWRWASCAGFDAEGRVVGLNLTHNVIEDDHDNNENGLWVGDQLSMFEAARFTFDPEHLLEPWTIETTDGRCRLTFRPEGERAGVIQAGVVASDYHQPYGTFSGEAVDDAGRVHAIQDFFGVTELHRARF